MTDNLISKAALRLAKCVPRGMRRRLVWRAERVLGEIAERVRTATVEEADSLMRAVSFKLWELTAKAA